MLPVVILAKYYSSTQSAVSERPNLNARLVFQMSQHEHMTRFRAFRRSRQAYSPAYFAPCLHKKPHVIGVSGQNPTGQNPTGQNPTGQNPTGQNPTT